MTSIFKRELLPQPAICGLPDSTARWHAHKRVHSSRCTNRVFNKSSGLVEVSSDVVFDETNGSPKEQVVDLDDVDEEDVPTAAIRTMAIGDVRPHEQNE